MKNLQFLPLCILFLAQDLTATAQVVSCASFLKAQPKADVVVPFRIMDEGVVTPIEWGLDLAWLDENNLKRGVNYVGKEMIDVVRTSYRPTESVEEGALSADQIKFIKDRSAMIKRNLKTGVGLVINDDPVTVDPWYNEKAAGSVERGKRWAKVIDLSIQKYKDYGLTNIVTISPFNEPDDPYGADQGYKPQRILDAKNISKCLKEDYAETYAGVRISGGNTLNPDSAYKWWNYSKAYLDEGNTHQLAGEFANYASFFEKVRQYGHHATADELHNTMEAMVGVEYGMQTGIWWYTCEHSRSQFMKATYHKNPGQRLAYAEHRNNWTSAAVYRHVDGSVQAFGGTSERQALPTTFNFVCMDRSVWYNGQRGHDYAMALPGGTGYQTGQSNAETVVDVQFADDPMPQIVAGAYKVVNVRSARLLGFASNPTEGWVTATQRVNSDRNYVQWVVEPMPETCGDDFSYYTLTLNNGKGMLLNILNHGLTAGTDVGAYPGVKDKNEQWFLEYAGNGAFYIRSRWSAKCLEVAGGSKTSGANVQMGDLKYKDYQQWRFLPLDVTPELTAPAAPTGLQAQPGAASVRLTWTAPADEDVAGYNILRSEDGQDFYAIAAGVTGTSFTDNEARDGQHYSYQVVAVDSNLNHSERSNVAEAGSTGEKACVMQLAFEENLYDGTSQGNHAALYDNANWTTGKADEKALILNGSTNFVQLPPTVATHNELTVSCWVNWRGGTSWQRIWDFGNGTTQYMFLTPKSDSGMRFAIKNGGDEQQIRVTSSLAANKWVHLCLTLGENGAVLYMNGEVAGKNEKVDIRPSDFVPVLNYIGRSQFAGDPLLKGYVDDFRIYNCCLTPDEVAQLAGQTDAVAPIRHSDNDVYYDLAGRRTTAKTKGLYVTKDRKVAR